VEYDLKTAVPVLSRTPAALDHLLRGLPDDWVTGTEGPGTWSPFDVVGHLIHGERTNWMFRVEHLLDHGESEPFPPFNRFGHVEFAKNASLAQLLDSFAVVRSENLQRLAGRRLTTADLSRSGTHPEFGRVTLAELLATWVVHDLDHLAQVARVMARQYADAVGPWRQYLRLLKPA
jgi:hypothetical protein